MSTIGNFLKDIREQKGLSTIEVQKQSGNRVSQSYVIQVEQGDKTPSVAKLEAFADVYGVDIHAMIDVMTGNKNKKSETPIVLSETEIHLIKQIRIMPNKKRKALITFLFE